jgi:hypothetical protein
MTTNSITATGSVRSNPFISPDSQAARGAEDISPVRNLDLNDPEDWGHLSSFVHDGLTFSPNYGASPPTLDISEGRVYLFREGSNLAVNPQAASGLELVDGTTNNIYIDGTASTSTIIYYATDKAAIPSPGALLIGTVDTANDTATETNRSPLASVVNARGVDVEDDGTLVVSDSTAINFKDNLTVADDADETVTVNAASSMSGFTPDQTEFYLLDGVSLLHRFDGTQPGAIATGGRVGTRDTVMSSGSSYAAFSVTMLAGSNPAVIMSGSVSGYTRIRGYPPDLGVGRREVDARAFVYRNTDAANVINYVAEVSATGDSRVYVLAVRDTDVVVEAADWNGSDGFIGSPTWSYTISSNSIRTVRFGDVSNSLAATADGGAFACDDASTLVRLEADGTVRNTRSVNNIYAIAADPTGGVWVTREDAAGAGELDHYTSDLSTKDATGEQFPGNDVAVMPNGDVVYEVATQNDGIFGRLATDGNQPWTGVVPYKDTYSALTTMPGGYVLRDMHNPDYYPTGVTRFDASESGDGQPMYQATGVSYIPYDHVPRAGCVGAYPNNEPWA